MLHASSLASTCSYKKDACIGDACPHLGTNFWMVFVTGMFLFFSALLLTSQSKGVSSSIHEMLGELFTMNNKAKE